MIANNGKDYTILGRTKVENQDYFICKSSIYLNDDYIAYILKSIYQFPKDQWELGEFLEREEIDAKIEANQEQQEQIQENTTDEV